MKLEATPAFRYPWDGLKAFLEEIQATHLALLSYGSLMNHASASLTLSAESIMSLTPAIGYGIKRYFNYKMPAEPLKRHGPPASEKHIAALNVTSTGNPADSVNGMIIHVPLSELGELSRREIGYDLKPVAVELWEPRTQVSPPVFVLECPTTDATILPHLRYLDICESGARSVSEAFLDYFRTTTFTADGTSLADWSKQQHG